ncbi:PAP2 superfamily protein [Burkholderia sp. Ch1-1]|uniref:PAP2 superfamily protein n=1 Tax=Paraburkholderia dioscoreae TaxID=2604047 RepID=A0A5Q4YXH6_9BURK|nr:MULTISPECIES: phosphatase PAP2 family protein [Paraburkholderia]EIF33513.1 PAP2 superfamily protein [Burkholderia sp. Ch1-1]MDR8395715.1 phosphatase PAP2 family protein [Paraburkholderia sp. USG1]VVD32372.1 PAP2 superfamily protein [Paraburkholderia dioscoreae]
MPKQIRALYWAAWRFTFLLMLIDSIWAARIGFRLARGGVMLTIALTCGLVAISGVLWILSRIPYKDVSRSIFYRNVLDVFLWITVLATFSKVCIVFQYLCVATNFPLATHAFIAADAALGFHWSDTYRWVLAHPWLHQALGWAYASGACQLFVVPVILAITRNTQDYAEFVVQFMVSATLVILISVPFPAESAFVHFGIHDPGTASTVSDFALFRTGQARELNLLFVQGLVSFPSLHTILALCFAYALRHAGYVFPIAIALNAFMIVSTLTQGGHYLADVLSGLVAGALVICLVRRFAFQAASPVAERIPSALTS